MNAFVKRYDLLLVNNPIGAGPHRILPIFWENVDSCWLHATPNTKLFLHQLQYSQENLPDDYPEIGLHQLKRTRRAYYYDAFLFAIGHRIVELATLPPLPPLPDNVDFENLGSAFRVSAKDQVPTEPVTIVRRFADLKVSGAIGSGGHLPGLQSPSAAVP
jgi:hypothetical protein